QARKADHLVLQINSEWAASYSAVRASTQQRCRLEAGAVSIMMILTVWGIARIRAVSSAKIPAVAFHRFKIGQQVAATAFGVLTGPYQIPRLLPLVAGIPHYRAKRLPNGPESAFSELSLRPMPEPADRNGTEAATPKFRGR